MEIQKLNKDFIPEELNEQEQEIWKIQAPQLIELGIVNSLNYLILIRYCSLYVNTQNFLRDHPKNTQGIKTRNQELKKLEEELCLTPNTYNKWVKDRLIIQDRKKKQEKGKDIMNEEDERFFQ